MRSARTFTFDAPFERRAVLLSSTPYMAPEARERVAQVAALGCYCVHDGDRTATLRKRNVAGAVSVWLQCDACGSALGSAMRREYHPRWQEYPVWDAEAAERYLDARETWRKGQPTYEDRQVQREAEYQARAEEYREWCRTSPEWREISRLVAWRSRGHCEACITGTATVVHHLTYQFGKLPPAWHLRAVCDACHDRLHCAGDDWCDYGMAK